MALKSFILMMFITVADSVLACATCMGPAEAPQTQGMNAAILTLFGVLCVVGLTVATFIGAIAWRVAHHPLEAGEETTPALTALATLES